MTISKPSRWEKQGTPASFLTQSYVAQSPGLKVRSISRSGSRKLQGQRQGPGVLYLTQNVPILGKTLNPRNHIGGNVLEQNVSRSTGCHLFDPFTPGHPALSPPTTATGFTWRSLRNGDLRVCPDLHEGTLSILGKTHMPGGRKMWRAGNCKSCLLESQRQMSKATQAR